MSVHGNFSAYFRKENWEMCSDLEGLVEVSVFETGESNIFFPLFLCVQMNFKFTETEMFRFSFFSFL